MTYAILVEDGTQWFTYLVELADKPKDSVAPGVYCERFFSLSRRVCDSDFCKNIFDRPFDIKTLNITIDNNYSFYGWHVSPGDFDRIRKMAELDGKVNEFEKLAKAV